MQDTVCRLKGGLSSGIITELRPGTVFRCEGGNDHPRALAGVIDVRALRSTVGAHLWTAKGWTETDVPGGTGESHETCDVSS
jgi:hypothetical protein